jgi:predicted dithiol-disulfide oxidoreductase (DUF899 family)
LTTHKTGTREQWLAARLELLKAEKELTRRSDELARQRQELPWVRIEGVSFETDEGGGLLGSVCLHFPLPPKGQSIEVQSDVHCLRCSLSCEAHAGVNQLLGTQPS